MDKTERMKDGTEVAIRRIVANDIDRLMEFYGSLPEEDRRYLKFDVTDRKVVAKRLRRVESGDDIRIAASTAACSWPAGPWSSRAKVGASTKGKSG